LLKDELQEIEVSLNELARALRVPMNRISAIVNGERAITVDTAMRLKALRSGRPRPAGIAGLGVGSASGVRV